ncbi:MAG: hypothetical protein COS29_00305 [Candidatus Omnitrophica bacterium CG02_land_8_20_14_3_00__42_8]|nr:MAG: hypothetical protein COS29_00305 [Candidatus Omnitrophica bacterium CG02_land_8_20_14_3_00__42_8]
MITKILFFLAITPLVFFGGIGAIDIISQREDCQIREYTIRGELTSKQKAVAEILCRGISEEILTMLKVGREEGFEFQRSLLNIIIEGNPKKEDLQIQFILVTFNFGSWETHRLEYYWTECPSAHSPIIREIVDKIVDELVYRMIVPRLPETDRSEPEPQMFRPIPGVQI